MRGRSVWQIGGFIAGGVLTVFGVVAIFMGATAYQTVGDELKQQYIVGSDDMNPSAIQQSAKDAGLPASVGLPTCNVAGKEIDTGAEARCFAQYMRIHALESTGGLAYAQIGRYESAANPSSAAGTNDPAAAAKDAGGQPISNGARTIWINETALSTALNVSFMAERLAVFGLVVGVALLLTGIGLFILAFAVFGRREKVAEPAAVRTATPVTG